MEVEAVDDALVMVKDKVEAKKTLNTTIYAERTIVFTAKNKDILRRTVVQNSRDIVMMEMERAGMN